MSPVGFSSNIVSERNCFVVKSSYSVLREICFVVKSSYSVLRGIWVVVKSSYSVIGYEIREINDSIVFFLVVFHTVSIMSDKLEIQNLGKEVEKTFVGVKQV